MKDILGIRREVKDKRYNELLLKDARVWDIIRHMVKRYVRTNLFVIGFWLELAVIIIIIIRK